MVLNMAFFAAAPFEKLPYAMGPYLLMVTIYHFTPNRVGACIYIAGGRVARGKAAFTNWTHPQTPALAGASVGTRKVSRLWFAVGVNGYIIAFFVSSAKMAFPPELIFSDDRFLSVPHPKSGTRALRPFACGGTGTKRSMSFSAGGVCTCPKSETDC